MRDIFEEIFINQPLDPMESARRNMRSARKRFYKAATVVETAEGFSIHLDGKPIRTPARRHLVAPSHALAQAIADEWQSQANVIDPASMPLTRLANAALDGVADNPQPVREEIVQYLGSDLVCYRAGEPAALVSYQAQHWDPVLAFARDVLGARFVLAEGIVFQAQPDHAIAAAAKAVPQDPWQLAAVSSIMTLTGSALIALAMSHGALSIDAAWDAAHADEDFQMQQWGRDELAMSRRAYRLAEMNAAATVLRLSRDETDPTAARSSSTRC